MLKSPGFNMLFQLVLTNFSKSELFSCLPKVGHVIKSCKEPIIIELGYSHEVMQTSAEEVKTSVAHKEKSKSICM